MENVIEKQIDGFVNIIENGLDLAAIDPRNGPQFSPNLYRFLKRRGQTWATTCRVYLDVNHSPLSPNGL